MSPAVALAAALLAVYALVGALDLGAGLLLPLMARGRDRDAALAGGGRPWSASAIWTLSAFALVVAGLPGSLAALRALWSTLVLMLLSLGLRGILTALRPHVLQRDLVDLGFGLASFIAAGCQGLILGWAVAGGTGTGLFAAASIWGLLCAAGVVGLYALLGSGWLVLSGRDAVRVFGREVGHAAATLTAGAVAACGLWALFTGVAGRTFARGWATGLSTALLGAALLGLLVAFAMSLWGRRPAAPLLWAVPSALCGLAAAATLVPAGAEAGLGLSAAYLALVLLIGSPLVLVDLLRRVAALRGHTAASGEEPTHAGRRAGALANGLHLS